MSGKPLKPRVWARARPNLESFWLERARTFSHRRAGIRCGVVKDSTDDLLCFVWRNFGRQNDAVDLRRTGIESLGGLPDPLFPIPAITPGLWMFALTERTEVLPPSYGVKSRVTQA